MKSCDYNADVADSMKWLPYMIMKCGTMLEVHHFMELITVCQTTGQGNKVDIWRTGYKLLWTGDQEHCWENEYLC
jgi:hypothetical protein